MSRFFLWFPYLLLAVVGGFIVVANIPRSPETDASSTSVTQACDGCGKEVSAADVMRATVDGRSLYYCDSACYGAFAADRPDVAPLDKPDGRLIDVVCHMEVSASWGIRSKYEGTEYHFCAKRCRERFDADPGSFLVAKCMVCDVPLEGEQSYPATYLGKTYRLCGVEHRTEFKADPASFFMHSMWGIPTWLYYASITIVLVVSFGVFDLINRRPAMRASAGSVTLSAALAPAMVPILSLGQARSDRFDLLSIGWVRAAFRSRVFRFLFQAFVSIVFLVIIAAGLFGNQNPALNVAPILTWTIWWGLLIILIMFAGKAWCYVCPWDAIAGWTEKLSLWRKMDDGLSLGMKWPRVIRNILIATVMFVGLTWIELGFGVTMKPRVTAYLAIAMLLMAVVSALVFDRKSFCRYGCLVGRVSGLYALFAGVEVRSKSANVCKACSGKECVTGSDTAYGCPTFLYPGKIEANTYCIQCMECLQTCPEDNLAVNLRPWGADLVVEGRPRADEAYLALLMLAITGFHGLTMTPVWQQMVDAIRSSSGLGRIMGFSLGMTMIMVGPIAVYALLVGASKQLGDRHAVTPLSYHDYFIRYAYALLPIALFYHIAHNSEHLLMEGPKIIALISDPFGWGWNVFGTAGWIIPPWISLDKLWMVQVLLVLVGHVYSLWVAQKTSLRLFGSPRAAFRSQIPMLIGMICFSVFSLWLLKQPMEMRTSAM